MTGRLSASRFARLIVTAILAGGGAVAVTAPAAQAAGIGVNLFVGYADDLRPGVNFPVPWAGAPNTTIIGNASNVDAGALRLDNPNATPVTVNDVSVDLQRPGPTFDLWGSFTIAPNSSVILTQTTPFNFDTSDFPITDCGVIAPPSDPRVPKVTLTIGGTPTSFLDTAHVLDTGGFDVACTGNNESLAWRAIGGTPCLTCGATLTLAPPTQTHVPGTTATTVATLLDPDGGPLPNVTVDFAVTSGPNAGTTGSATTDSAGHASFSYTGAALGTDTVVASVTNATGASFSSNTVTVLWVTRNGVFSCTATALRLAGLTAARANPADLPCADDHQTVANITLNALLVTVKATALDASTDLTPDNLAGTLPAAGDHGSAAATVDTTRITVGLTVIEVGVIHSTAAATCVAGPGGLSPVFTGSSSIASLKINGLVVTVGSAPLTIPLVIGTLRLNAQTVTATTITQQALALTTVLTSVVLGEAKADIAGTPAHPSGNPCQV